MMKLRHSVFDEPDLIYKTIVAIAVVFLEFCLTFKLFNFFRLVLCSCACIKCHAVLQSYEILKLLKLLSTLFSFLAIIEVE